MSRQIRKHQHIKNPEPFSEILHAWLKSNEDKTLGGLSAVFAEKSFAIIFLLLMALPALPIPTGGITHVTELIAMLVCLELIVGRRVIWLPKKWLEVDVGKVLSAKAIGRLIAVIRWFEKFSRRRLGGLLTLRPVLSLIGLVVLLFTVAAFVAPPFSGLDTLPALGVVIISLALILEDMAFLVAGVLIGCTGIALEISAGAALYSGFTHLF
ncbi:MAG: exopolysaccharide biosynthesis protein [Patescibacteria group bacterium]